MGNGFADHFITCICVTTILFCTTLLFTVSTVGDGGTTGTLYLLLIYVISFTRLNTGTAITLGNCGSGRGSCRSCASRVNDMVGSVGTSSSSLCEVRGSVSCVRLRNGSITSDRNLLFSCGNLRDCASACSTGISVFVTGVNCSSPTDLARSGRARGCGNPASIC